MLKKITKSQRIAKLERENLELQAYLPSSCHFANAALDKASVDKMMGSGVLLQLTAIGGKEITVPTIIRDGLSEETILAIRKDLKRSYDLGTMLKL
jgi:hypothetical protein